MKLPVSTEEYVAKINAAESVEEVKRAFNAFAKAVVRTIVQFGVRAILAEMDDKIIPKLEKLYRERNGTRLPGSWRTKRLAKKRRKALFTWYEEARLEGKISDAEEETLCAWEELEPATRLPQAPIGVMLTDEPCEQLQP